MNDLEQYFRQNNKRLIQKWIHYFDVYDRHFSRFRGKDMTILEIGVSQGGSLQMWKNYFGPNAKIYGMDINPQCKALEEENIKIFIGSQADRKFLQEVKRSIPPVDILLDDGGHTMRLQIITYEELFGHIRDNGVYLCEDLMTSYWLKYGGGLKRRGTFIEYSKNLIDFLNAHHSEQKSLPVSTFTRTADSIHYYDGIVVIEKKIREKPHDEMIGEWSNPKTVQKPGFLTRSKRQILTMVNSALRFFRLPSIFWR